MLTRSNNSEKFPPASLRMYIYTGMLNLQLLVSILYLVLSFLKEYITIVLSRVAYTVPPVRRKQAIQMSFGDNETCQSYTSSF